MPVPMSVMEAAAQGNKKAMRLVEKEYGVGNGQDFAIDQLSEEFPPGRVVAIDGARTYGQSQLDYKKAGAKQIQQFELELFGKEIDKLKPADQKDFILELSKADPYGDITDWANQRFNNPVSNRELAMYKYYDPNDPEDFKLFTEYKNTPTNPTIQPALNYYKEKFKKRNKGLGIVEKKQPSLEFYDKEIRMVEKKQPSLEKVEFDKSPELLTEEEVRKKKEREELEEYFRSRGL